MLQPRMSNCTLMVAFKEAMSEPSTKFLKPQVGGVPPEIKYRN